MFGKFFDKFAKKAKKAENPDDRRRANRVNARFLVKMTDLAKPGREILTNIYDLSETGVRVVCHAKLPLQTMLRILLNVPDRGLTLPLKGKVVWISPIKGQKGAFFAGVQFVEMSEADRQLLHDLSAGPIPPEPA